MSFAHPLALLGMGVPLVLAIVYAVVVRRRRKDTLRFTALETLESILPKRRTRLARHAPAALLVTSLAIFSIALAGPTGRSRYRVTAQRWYLYWMFRCR